MVRGNTFKNAAFPNAKPAWQKNKIKDPLVDWLKVRGWVDSKQMAEGTARGLRMFNNRTKVVKEREGYRVYYQKRIVRKRK